MLNDKFVRGVHRTSKLHHLNYFRSYAELQLEIGHRDATLLLYRAAGSAELLLNK